MHGQRAPPLGLKDDDWEEDEKDIQKAFGDLVQWVTGSDAAGDTVSEATLRGLSRLIDLEPPTT